MQRLQCRLPTRRTTGRKSGVMRVGGRTGDIAARFQSHLSGKEEEKGSSAICTIAFDGALAHGSSKLTRPCGSVVRTYTTAPASSRILTILASSGLSRETHLTKPAGILRPARTI